jgi:hypothetical protein
VFPYELNCRIAVLLFSVAVLPNYGTGEKFLNSWTAPFPLSIPFPSMGPLLFFLELL